jgi:hypothetical protein
MDCKLNGQEKCDSLTAAKKVSNSAFPRHLAPLWFMAVNELIISNIFSENRDF